MGKSFKAASFYVASTVAQCDRKDLPFPRQLPRALAFQLTARKEPVAVHFNLESDLKSSKVPEFKQKIRHIKPKLQLEPPL